ncbi:PepSY domain-containing protein [Shouchella lehensis]|uniref:PepSY domain-containing protein n=1 Tax=Shouchella lehensis TaxID=300825 RepID=A0A4Y7WJV4_9BACI|nr:PepSY domain-containing protein [Shouchella lehensis]TES48405.1 hypothetical protein E2L03_14930 [Shouchella lehensis]
MTRIRKWLLLVACCLLVVTGMFMYRWLQQETLSDAEISAIVMERFDPNEMESFTYKGDEHVYQLTFLKGSGEYELTLDATSGSIQSLQLLNQRETPLSEKEIEAILLEAYPEQGIEISNMNLQDNRYYVDYSVDGRTGEVEVDAVTGHIIRTSLEEEQAILSPDQAIEIALSEIPGTVEDVEQETRNNRLVYEVELEDTGRDDDALVIIDAYTGEIISVIWD